MTESEAEVSDTNNLFVLNHSHNKMSSSCNNIYISTKMGSFFSKLYTTSYTFPPIEEISMSEIHIFVDEMKENITGKIRFIQNE